MKKIQVLFMSMQPALLAALAKFFTADPFIISNTDDYNNYDNKNKKYDVVVFDDAGLNNKGLEMVKSAFTAKNRSKNILYTESTNKKYLSFMESGFYGIVAKDKEFCSLREAIMKSVKGKKFLSGEMKELLKHNNDTREKIESLTARQKEILQLRKLGYTNREISGKLSIKVKTVENHLENIKATLGLKSVKEFRNLF